MILKAEHLCKGVNARFVVANVDHAPSGIYDGLYAQRGDMEKQIKEQQLETLAAQRKVAINA